MIHAQAFIPGAPSSGRIVASPTAEPSPQLAVSFDRQVSAVSAGDGFALSLAIPCLGCDRVRAIPLNPGISRQVGPFAVWEDIQGHRLGACVIPWKGTEREAIVREAYRELLALNGDVHLHRLWNFVPQINESTGGQENYRRFCIGRSEAFAEHFGPEAKAHMPAASAVGVRGSSLVIAFLAGREPATHFENPLQVPAYEYPREHGPRPPSFARGTLVHRPVHRDVFISGTAAVRGHLSTAPGDLEGQISTTLEMLASLGETMNIGADLGAATARSRQFIVYLRHAADLAVVRERLERSLFAPTDTVTYLETDICRRELLLEIEGSARLL